MNYDSTKPYCGFESAEALIADLAQAFRDAIVVPNEWLPEEYHNRKQWESGNLRDLDGKVFGPTLAQIEKTHQRLYGERIQKHNEEAEREARIQRYADQYAESESFEYEVNEDKLYRNEVAFCSASQLIDQDDIDEERFFG